jgi:hypothetical protein
MHSRGWPGRGFHWRSRLPAKSWSLQSHASLGRRHFGLESIPGVLLPPVVFGGLLVALWTYKCTMMVIFQNKIIYMPSVPPFSRSEKVEDYAAQCRPVQWTEHDLKAADGTKLKLLEGTIAGNDRAESMKHVVVVYFQGQELPHHPLLPMLTEAGTPHHFHHACRTSQAYSKRSAKKTLVKKLTVLLHSPIADIGNPKAGHRKLESSSTPGQLCAGSMTGTQEL